MTESKISSGTESQYVRVNGIEMHVMQSGVGPALVMIHGGMGTALDNFSAAIEELSSNFKVFAPDSRGHGKTRNPAMQLSYSLMADDIADLISKMQLNHPYVFGWSDGGQIALDLAIRYPNLPAAIAVGGAYIHLSDQYIDGGMSIGIRGPGEVDFDVLSENIPDAVDHWNELHSDQGVDYWKELFLALSHAQRNPPPYTEVDLKKIVQPTLIFLGDRDQFVPVEQAVEMYRLIPNAELAIVPDTDHSMGRNASLIARLAKEFFVKQLEGK